MVSGHKDDHLTPDPIDPTTPSTPPPDLGGTLVQAGEELSQARDLSSLPVLKESSVAPRIPGYQLTEPLGRGTYAQVWKAVQARSGKPVAIKVFLQSSGVNWLFLRREVERLVRLDKHPHVVSLLDADLSHDPPYYVTDLLEGGSLEGQMTPAKPVPPAKVAAWLEQIAHALAYVHGKGIIHCDLKPANVLLDEAGQVRVADFGQARVLADESGALGTLFYMAPEQARIGDSGGSLQPDVRWDLYALGATAYALLTGRAPYAETLSAKLESSPTLAERLKVYRELAKHAPALDLKTVPGLDEDLCAIVGKCLATEPDKRYGSSGAVLADLLARRERRPVGPLLHLRSYRIKRYIQRNAITVGVAAVLLLGIAGAMAQVVLKQREVHRQLAYSYLLRAHLYADRGDDVDAALCFAELNRFSPTRMAEANALGFLDRLAEPRLVISSPESEVTSAELSRDGARIVTGHRNGTIRIWDAGTGLPIGGPIGTRSEVNEGVIPAFTPDGSRVVTRSGDSGLRLWACPSGELVRSSPEWPNLDKLLVSPAGDVVAAWSHTSPRVRLWWPDSGRSLTITGTGNMAVAIFSRSGKDLVAVSLTGIIQGWSVESGRLEGKPIQDRPTDPNAVLQVSGDGAVVWLGRTTRELRAYDWRRGKVLRTLVTESAISTFVLSPDGTRVVTACENGAAIVWDPRSGAHVGDRLPFAGRVLESMLTPDGSMYLGVTGEGTVYAWNLATGERAGRIMAHPDLQIWRAGVSPDGKRLAISSKRGVYVWDLVRRRLDRTSIDPEAWSLIASSGDGSRIVSAHYDGTARIWDSASEAPVGEPVTIGSAPLAAALDGAGRRAVVSQVDGSLQAFETKAGRSPPALLSFPAYPWIIQFTPDGSRFLCAGGMHLQIWDTATWKPLRPAMELADEIMSLAVSPDGRRFSLGTKAGQVEVRDLSSGELVGSPLRHRGFILAMRFSPDGARLAVTDQGSGEATIWTLGEQREPVRVRHPDNVISFAFSPDGRRLATGCLDGSVRVWDAGSGRPVCPSLGASSGIPVLTFAESGRWLVAGSFGGNVRIWDVETGQPVGPVLVCSGPLALVQEMAGGHKLLTVSGGYPQIEIRDLAWLGSRAASEELWTRIAARTGRQLNELGGIEPIAGAEWQALRARMTASAR